MSVYHQLVGVMCLISVDVHVYS